MPKLRKSASLDAQEVAMLDIANDPSSQIKHKEDAFNKQVNTSYCLTMSTQKQSGHYGDGEKGNLNFVQNCFTSNEKVSLF